MTSPSASGWPAGDPVMPPAIGRVRFAAGKTIWLWGMAIPGLILGIPAMTPTTTVASLGLAFVTLCLGHSVGLHRGAIHRTYQAGPVVRGVLVYLFVLSGLGGPLSWARLHAVRDYWQNRPDCPRYFSYSHSLARDFVWNMHLRFEPADDRADARLFSDVLRDPWLRFLERTWPAHVGLLALVILLALGPGGVAACVCARTAAGIVGHWFVGYAAHAWGERRFVVPGAMESGTNVWILGVLSFGEGFHNNHHAFPSSARMGMRPRELDLGWAAIWALERLRLVHDVVAWHRAPAGDGLDGAHASRVRGEKSSEIAARRSSTIIDDPVNRLHTVGERSQPSNSYELLGRADGYL